MSNVELTHAIMRKLTAALAKVDSGNLRHFERINLVAEAFGWKGDALMHHLKKSRDQASAQPAADDPSFGAGGPTDGSIKLFIGPSPATRMAFIGTYASFLAEKLSLPVYNNSDTWRLRDRLVPAGIIIISLRTLDDWRHAARLAEMGNHVLVDTWRAEDDLSKMLPLLGALPEEMALVSQITRVDQLKGDDGKAFSQPSHQFYPFRLG